MASASIGSRSCLSSDGQLSNSRREDPLSIPGIMRVGFVVDEVERIQDFLSSIFIFRCPLSFHRLIHTHTYILIHLTLILCSVDGYRINESQTKGKIHEETAANVSLL
jgi:hypothetical protein